MEPIGQVVLPSSATPRPMKPGTVPHSASRISPATNRRTFAASSAARVFLQRSTRPSRYSPLNIAPFSIGVHQPSAFGRPARHSSGVGMATAPSRSVKSSSTS
jgi:hypothetical protein